MILAGGENRRIGFQKCLADIKGSRIIERNLKKFAAIDWKSIFPHAQKLPANPVMAIQVNRKKPHRILLAFKFTGAVIWNIKV